MSKHLEDTIKELMIDITPLSISREEFLALCARNRIEEMTKSYDREFDKFLDRLTTKEFDKDITESSKSLRKFSKSVKSIYGNLIRQFEVYQNKFK